jgi:hypothetical protein
MKRVPCRSAKRPPFCFGNLQRQKRLADDLFDLGRALFHDLQRPGPTPRVIVRAGVSVRILPIVRLKPGPWLRAAYMTASAKEMT